MVCSKHRFYTLSLAYSNTGSSFLSSYQKLPQGTYNKLPQTLYNGNTNQQSGYNASARPSVNYITRAKDTGSFFTNHAGFQYAPADISHSLPEPAQTSLEAAADNPIQLIPRTTYEPMQLYKPMRNQMTQTNMEHEMQHMAAPELTRKVIQELTEIQRVKRNRLEQVLHV